jgi:hypothetical protein
MTTDRCQSQMAIGPLRTTHIASRPCSIHTSTWATSGSGFSARAFGGAFGTASIDATVNSKPASTVAPQISDTVVSAGHPESSVRALPDASRTDEAKSTCAVAPGIPVVVASASHQAYAYASKLAW